MGTRGKEQRQAGRYMEVVGSKEAEKSGTAS